MSEWILITAAVVALGLTAWAWYAAFDGKGWLHRVGVLLGMSALVWWCLVGIVKVVAIVAEDDSVFQRGARALSVWDLVPFGIAIGSAVVAVRNQLKSGADKIIKAKADDLGKGDP